ncbi:uncharacterized protein LOC144109584 [Amblyomma americanum]
MAVKRNVCFQGLPSLDSSEGIGPTGASWASSKEFRVLSSPSDVTSTDDCDPAQSLAGSAPGSGDSAKLYSDEETLTASSGASSNAAYVRGADYQSRSSSTAAASVSLLQRSGTASTAPGDRERRVRRVNALLLGFLGLFLAACAAVVFADRRWNLFAGDAALPAAADGVAASAAAAPASAKLRAAASTVAGQTNEVRPSSTTKGVVSAAAAPSPLSKRRKGHPVVRERTTTPADVTTETGVEDDATSDDAYYRTKPKHHISSRRRDTRRETARAGRKAHAPRGPASKGQPFQNRPPARPECGAPMFTLCSEPRREVYYRPDADACVQAAGSSAVQEPKPPLCNRSPNRFGSLGSCRRSCMAATMPAQRCFDKPLFTACSRQLVNPTWWFFDGRRCLPWQFPVGQCPDPGHVFRSRAQCNRQCNARPIPAGAEPPTWKPSQRCRSPSRLACGTRQLRFPYFAEMSRKGRVRCRLTTEESLLRAKRCLVGPNRHRSLGHCRASCVRRRSSRGVRTRAPWRNQERRASQRRWRSERRLH